MENNSNNKKNNIPKFKFSIYWIYLIILGGILLVSLFDNGESEKKVSMTELEEYIKKGEIKRMIVQKGNEAVDAYVKEDHVKEVFGKDAAGNDHKLTVVIPSADSFYDFSKIIKEKYKYDGEILYKENHDFFMSFLINVLPFVLLIGIWIFLMRRMSGGAGGSGGTGGIFNVGRSKARLFDKNTKNRITFKDVAGQEEAKEEVQEIVSFLKSPKKYTELGGKIPKGALLVGPPGTGKTLLAKAVAGEANVPFFSLSGSDFVEMFVGVGASRVRDLFKQAKEKSPCIIFIDEIDAIGRARGKNPNMGSNDERENTLNQLLTEMDGFASNSGVIILAATNRVDILDKALLRAGRFDRQISVDLPDLKERRAIFDVHLRPIKYSEHLDIEELARQTPGFSGADIANVCNEAALIAARKNKKAVERQDFLDAVDRIVGGLEKKNKIMTESERKSIAIHEAGHASISWVLEHANPLVKVTIVPRGKALGAAWYLPEERQLTTKDQMLDELCSLLGGRAAEELFIGQISSGALNDLERVTKQAYAIVAYFGMSKNLRNVSYFDSTGSYQYSFSKPYSEKTSEKIDEEVKNLISEQYERAKSILSENKEKHNALAKLLVEREVIYTADAERIFGKRPWASRTEILLKEQEESEKNKKAKKELVASENKEEPAKDIKSVPEHAEDNNECKDTTEQKEAEQSNSCSNEENEITDTDK